jgi:hypothetical protein
MPALVNGVNQNFAKLDAEAVTKVYSGPGGNAVVEGRLPNDLGYGQILYDRSGKAAIYMAVDANGNPVFKVAKTDKDATTGTDSDLIFNSSQNTFKIALSGTTQLTAPNAIGGSTNVSVSFTLGTKPIVFAFASLTPTGTRFPLPLLQPQLAADPTPGLIAYQINYEVVTDVLTFYWRDISKATNLTAYITYYILQETAS